MNVVFDSRWTKIGHHDGISRFGANLLDSLLKITPVTVLIYDLRQLEMLPKNVPYLLVNNPVSPRELLLPLKLNKLGVDVVYSPMQIMGSFGRNYKLIFTLHDLVLYTLKHVSEFKHPSLGGYLGISPSFFIWLMHRAYWPQRLVLNQADLIVTVSETTKQDILRHHLTDRPVEVVYNATPDLGPGKAHGDIKRELVFMGTLLPYKNAELLIKALELLPDYHLHLPGRGTPDRLSALKALADPYANRVTFWNGASDQEYAKMLDSATAMVSASRFEGFGLPIVEAMARDVPVVCTDMPIFHEVAGQAALYFDPDSPADFAAKIHEVENPARRTELIKLGRAQAATFSWEKSAGTLLKIMTSLKNADAVPLSADTTPTKS